MSVEFKYKKHISIVCNLSIGQVVTVSGWGYKLDGKNLVIEDIKLADHACQSGVMVKVDKYSNYIDSDWIDKKQ